MSSLQIDRCHVCSFIILTILPFDFYSYSWIGSESSQDEYGVAAYKANELDDLLGTAPVQHREVEGSESEEFTNCFTHGVQYLEGGVASGFRDVDPDSASVELPTRLFQIHKKGRQVRSFQVPATFKSLNEGDAFLLDCDSGKKIYTWYGNEANPFEKNKAGEMAHNMASNRHGHCEVQIDIGNDNEDFWQTLGGRGHIKPASAAADVAIPEHQLAMYSVSHEGGQLKIDQVEPAMDNLDTNKVFIVDDGPKVFIWVGKESSTDESRQAMLMVEKHLSVLARSKTTSVMRVLEGQEHRGSFAKVFK